jgi:DNA-binding NtrC family response regulator
VPAALPARAESRPGGLGRPSAISGRATCGAEARLRAAVILGGDLITAADLALPADGAAARASGPVLRLAAGSGLGLRELRAQCEREYVLHVLEREGWNLAAAARALGLQRTYLHAKLASLGIARPRSSSE